MNINIEGVSTFFYFSIPAILALAAVYWLVFTDGFITVRRGLIMDKRHNEIVGARKLPKSTIALVLTNTERSKLKIARAEIYGTNLTVWIRNDGDKPAGRIIGGYGSINLTWRSISPDGTVIGSDMNCLSYNVNLLPGQVAEYKTTVPSDRRTERLELEVDIL